MSKTITCSIVGASGYTGLELLRLIKQHPNIQISSLVSGSNAGTKVSDLWPHLKGIYDEEMVSLDAKKLTQENDCVFLALPHLESQRVVPELLGKVKIIDLAGDFRLKDPAQFAKYYGHEHIYEAGLPSFVYGVPEFFKDQITKASAIANPGCFAITTQLALYPLKGNIESVEVLAVTGSSGSGKSPTPGTHHPVRSHNMASYKIGKHQHLPEIMQTLGIDAEQIAFVPTSGPFTRGIHLTAFVKLNSPMGVEEVKMAFKSVYKDAPFVRIKEYVQLAEVIGSNYCDISVTQAGGAIIIQAAIDNLVKGAAGTAIQNFNLMFGLEETAGLSSLAPLFP